MIELYSRDGCAFCHAAKTILEWQKIDHKEYIIEKDITRDEVKEKFPDSKLLPIVVIDGNMIGGYNDLLQYLSDFSTKENENDRS